MAWGTRIAALEHASDGTTERIKQQFEDAERRITYLERAIGQFDDKFAQHSRDTFSMQARLEAHDLSIENVQGFVKRTAPAFDYDIIIGIAVRLDQIDILLKAGGIDALLTAHAVGDNFSHNVQDESYHDDPQDIVAKGEHETRSAAGGADTAAGVADGSGHDSSGCSTALSADVLSQTKNEDLAKENARGGSQEEASANVAEATKRRGVQQSCMCYNRRGFRQRCRCYNRRGVRKSCRGYKRRGVQQVAGATNKMLWSQVQVLQKKRRPRTLQRLRKKRRPTTLQVLQ